MRLMRVWVVLLLIPASVGSPWVAAAMAQTAPPACTCASADSQRLDTGVVWQGNNALGLAEIAAITAPALWFSSDEPLLEPGLRPTPSSHPCDAPAPGPIVYYQVTRLALRGSDIQATGFPTVESWRFVWEIGAGVHDAYRADYRRGAGGVSQPSRT